MKRLYCILKRKRHAHERALRLFSSDSFGSGHIERFLLPQFVKRSTEIPSGILCVGMPGLVQIRHEGFEFFFEDQLAVQHLLEGDNFLIRPAGVLLPCNAQVFVSAFVFFLFAPMIYLLDKVEPTVPFFFYPLKSTDPEPDAQDSAQERAYGG